MRRPSDSVTVRPSPFAGVRAFGVLGLLVAGAPGATGAAGVACSGPARSGASGPDAFPSTDAGTLSGVAAPAAPDRGLPDGARLGGAAAPTADAARPPDGPPRSLSPDGGASSEEASDDPMALHKETREELLALFTVQTFEGDKYKLVRPDIFLGHHVGPAYTKMNQGNKALARHTIGKRACLDRLQGVVLQSAEQKATCGGEKNMVPIWKGGDPKAAAYCIDLFEFPNEACELPTVWLAPSHAEAMCELQGKRLCTQGEWSLACRADPGGGPDQTYAYGNALDLDVCNTNKHRGPKDGKCDPRSAKSTWESCRTESEPAGSFPKCKSRFGVYDQHGNVAEIMTRKEGDVVYSQLKGSAWFYVDVAREPGKPPPPENAGRETYPDHCNFDPRWHVEKMEAAWHVNYHLGFRCCKPIVPAALAAPPASPPRPAPPAKKEKP